ncbi:MAG: ArnT family glycosyltransferase [Candidatus Xenobiia bacterium LiM19]
MNIKSVRDFRFNAASVKNPATIAFIGVVVIAVIQFLCTCRVPLSGDEAYYWMWSKRLALGYYDHPPMVAWLIALGTAILGDTPQGARLMSVVLSAATSLLLFNLCYRISRKETVAFGAIALYWLIPFLAVESVMTIPDAGLIFFWTLSMTLFYDAVLGKKRWTSWFLGGITWALAFYSKFTALIFLPSMLLFLIISPSGRQSLRHRGPWLALGAAVVTLIPYILWNVSNQWISLHFQLMSRHAVLASASSYLSKYLLLQSAALSPLMPLLFIYVIWKAVRLKSSPNWEAFLYLISLSVPTYLFFLYVSLHEQVEINWPVAGVLGLVVLTPLVLLDQQDGAVKRMELKIAGAASAVALLFMILIYSVCLNPELVVRISGRYPGDNNPGNGFTMLYGYSDAPRHIELLRSQIKDDFIIASDINFLSAILSFHSRSYVHMCYGNLQGSEYRKWESEYSLKGRNMLYITIDRWGSREDVVKLLQRTCREVQPLEPWKLMWKGHFCGELYPVMCRNLVAPAVLFPANALWRGENTVPGRHPDSDGTGK